MDHAEWLSRRANARVGVRPSFTSKPVSVPEANLMRADPAFCTEQRHAWPTLPRSAEDEVLRREMVLLVNSGLRDQLIVKLLATGMGHQGQIRAFALRSKSYRGASPIRKCHHPRTPLGP